MTSYKRDLRKNIYQCLMLTSGGELNVGTVLIIVFIIVYALLFSILYCERVKEKLQLT